MSIVEIVLLGVALSMDAFAVTISNVFCYPNASRARLLALPVAFGVFQAGMPLLGYFLGGNDGLLYALLAFVVLDYITGVMCAVADKKLSSAVGFKGICRKVLSLRW